MINLLRAIILLASIFPFAAHAELRLTEDDGAPAIVSRDTLAAFRPTENELWVVSSQGPLLIDSSVADKAGWKAEQLDVKGGVGMRIVQQRPHAWRLRILPWGWKVVEGDAKNLPPVRLNVLRLKDGVRVEGQNVLRAQSKLRRYWVLPAAGPVPGGEETLSGLAINIDAPAPVVTAPVNAAPTPTTPKPVAAPQPSATVPVRPVAKPVSVTAPAAVPPLTPVSSALPKPVPVKTSNKIVGKVPVFAAGPLHAVATPTTVVEDLKAVARKVASSTGDKNVRIYQPGMLILFRLPPEWVIEHGKVVPAEQVKRRQARAQALSAVEVALEQTRKVNLPLPVEKPVAQVSAVAMVSGSVESSSSTPPQVALADDKTDVAAEIVWPKVTNNQDYVPQAQLKLAQVATAPAKKKNVLREDLALFDVAWGRGSDALAALALNGDTLPSRGRFIRALAYLQNGRPADALQDLDELTARKVAGHEDWQSSLAMWRTVALSQLGRGADALKSWPVQEGEVPDVLAGYPLSLRTMAKLEYVSALADVGNLAAARRLADEIAAAYVPAQPDKKPEGATEDFTLAPPRVTLLRGLSRLNTRDEKEGLRMLAAAAEQHNDLRSAYQAKFAFVDTLQRRGELSQPQYVKYLAELARFWRGDALEVKVLRELGKQYALIRDYRSALTAYRDLVHVAPNLGDMADVTDKMTAALVAAFDPESPSAYEPLEYVGMYYDFKELVPADDRGDRITERVAEILLQLGLPERSAPIAEQLLKFRLKDPTSQGRVALLLANAQREMGEAATSLKTLDQWHPIMKTTIQQQDWQVAEARALTELGQLAAAQKALKDRQDAGVQQIKADVAWQRQDWKTLADTLRPVVGTLNPSQVSGSLPMAVVKLAYAEAENRNGTSLKQLQQKWSGVGGDNSAAVFSTLEGTLGVTPSAVLAQQPLGQVAGSIAAAEQLTQRIQLQSRQTAVERQQRRDYDDKMRYMDLLPPPSL